MGELEFTANAELDNPFKCIICDKEAGFRFTSIHKEAVCCSCGTPYIIMFFNEKGKKIKGNDPVINVTGELVPILKEYFEATGQFIGLGEIIDANEGFEEGRINLSIWLEEHYPDMVETIVLEDESEGDASFVEAVQDGIDEGDRNNIATKYAGILLMQNNADEAATLEALLEWNENNRPPMDEEEVKGILDSAVIAYNKNTESGDAENGD